MTTIPETFDAMIEEIDNDIPAETDEDIAQKNWVMGELLLRHRLHPEINHIELLEQVIYDGYEHFGLQLP